MGLITAHMKSSTPAINQVGAEDSHIQVPLSVPTLRCNKHPFPEAGASVLALFPLRSPCAGAAQDSRYA